MKYKRICAITFVSQAVYQSSPAAVFNYHLDPLPRRKRHNTYTEEFGEQLRSAHGGLNYTTLDLEESLLKRRRLVILERQAKPD